PVPASASATTSSTRSSIGSEPARCGQAQSVIYAPRRGWARSKPKTPTWLGVRCGQNGSKRVGIGLDGGRKRMPLERGRVLPRHLSDDVIGEPPELLVNGALSVRPCGVAVRVVGLEQDVVRADPLILDER